LHGCRDNLSYTKNTYYRQKRARENQYIGKYLFSFRFKKSQNLNYIIFDTVLRAIVSSWMGKKTDTLFGIKQEAAGDSRPHLLIFAHYYIPDVASTGQIIKELAEGLLDTFRVTVVCTVPSYKGVIAQQYKTLKFYEENINDVNVIRISVPEFSKADKMSRIRNILAYFAGAIQVTEMIGKVDYVYSISQPPILGGMLGVYAKWRKKAKFIYNIQDFNPEQTMAVKYSDNKFVLGLMLRIDKYSCSHSDLVITVGRDLGETLEHRFAGRKVPNYTIINNWMDEKKLYPLPLDNTKVSAFRNLHDFGDDFVIMYSGNIGLYYDLEGILKVIERFKPGTKTVNGRNVRFVFVGEGSLADTLEVYASQHHMDNVEFLPYQSQSDLIYSLNSADVHWCISAKGIKGVSCPSKYYGIAAVAKPVLAVLEKGSEIRTIIEETGSGICCDPEDYAAVENGIRWFLDHAGDEEFLVMGEKGHENLLKNLTKDISIRKYRDAILNC
jgi:glycosyltransferase involved in cell wall biosynthesis